uniref:UPAR/Ly6 domain-containing protein n=1 Tax=Monodon monoceros TaxID=40151 RepID=A0A8C6C795_MONMO
TQPSCPLSLGLCPCPAPALSLWCYTCYGISNVGKLSQCQPTQCNWSPAVCFRGDLTTAMGSGEFPAPRACGWVEGGGSGNGRGHTVLAASITPKSEVWGVTCCAKDLCDGVAPTGRSLWALAAGLLLSLGPTFLWVLL